MENQSIGKSIMLDDKIEDGFYLLKFHNEEEQEVEVSRNVDKSFLQLHFH